jgi:hypothetical protein
VLKERVDDAQAIEAILKFPEDTVILKQPIPDIG